MTNEIVLRAPTPEEIAQAQLPARYESACKAIAECSQIDELKDMADKQAALASYARQARDHTLHNLAQRIQLRATRRYGELLKQTPRGDEATRYGQMGAHPPAITRTQAARDAGISKHQATQAMRVASIPESEFEEALANDTPPTVTTLAERGKTSRPPEPREAIVPADRAQVAAAYDQLRQFAAFCGTHDPARIACAPSVDGDLFRGLVDTIDNWLDKFVTRLPDEEAA
jgi:hypothetical protein